MHWGFLCNEEYYDGFALWNTTNARIHNSHVFFKCGFPSRSPTWILQHNVAFQTSDKTAITNDQSCDWMTKWRKKHQELIWVMMLNYQTAWVWFNDEHSQVVAVQMYSTALFSRCFVLSQVPGAWQQLLQSMAWMWIRDKWNSHTFLIIWKGPREREKKKKNTVLYGYKWAVQNLNTGFVWQCCREWPQDLVGKNGREFLMLLFCHSS